MDRTTSCQNKLLLQLIIQMNVYLKLTLFTCSTVLTSAACFSRGKSLPSLSVSITGHIRTYDDQAVNCSVSQTQAYSEIMIRSAVKNHPNTIPL